jgi:tetratricopeptide (TPR) repeat protein
MKKKKDALLQQIAENSKESLVFFETGYTIQLPFGAYAGNADILSHVEIGSGFFVEPDKIVTTIDFLATTHKVAAIPSDSLAETVTNSAQVPNDNQDPNFWKEIGMSIEGIAAFDAKHNLVLLKVADTGVPLPLEDSDTVQIDEKVYTSGYLDCNEHKCIQGTFQSRYRNDKWFQIKTDYFLGICGGPVLNSKNEVIGMINYSIGTLAPDSNATVATVVSSNVLKELLANSGKVIPLEKWQKYGRIRAYALEAKADEMADMNDDRQAIKDYNAALKLNPDLVEIYSKRGMLKARIEDIRGAYRDFDKMIQINPEHIFAYSNRGSAKASLGDYQGALDDINKAIEINPEYMFTYINLGGVKMHIAENKMDEGDTVEALRYYQEAIDDLTKLLSLDIDTPLAREIRRSLKPVQRMLRLAKLQHETE